MIEPSVSLPEVSWPALARGEPGACRAFVAGCRESGALLLRGSPLTAQRQTILERAAVFFAQPAPEKRRLHISRSAHFRGYTRLGEEQTDGLPDLKESYDFGLEQVPTGGPMSCPDTLLGPNLWPSTSALPHFERDLRRFLDAVQTVGTALLECLLRGLDLDVGIDDLLGHPRFSLARLSRYPGRCGPGEGTGLGTHTDYGLFVFVLQSEVPGLALRVRDGRWLMTRHRPERVVVMLGDVLQMLTGGDLRATPHRVELVGDRHRHAAIGFFEPSLDAVITRQRGRPMLYGTHLHRALVRSFPSVVAAANGRQRSGKVAAHA